MATPQGPKYSNDDDASAAAERDARRDSVGAFGRGHGARTLKSTYGIEGIIPRHHSGDAYYEQCYECKADAKRGEHPSAPKN